MKTPKELEGTDFEPVYGFDVIAGTRLEDGLKVFVRLVFSNSKELELLRKLNAPDVRSDSRNPAIPVLEFIPSSAGDLYFVVMEMGDSIHSIISPESLVQIIQTLFSSSFFIETSIN